MTEGVVPDASVAVKWLLEESGSDRAEKLLGVERKLLAPSLLRVEVAAAIARRFRLGAIELKDAQERLAEALDLIAHPRVTLVPDNALLERAGQIALLLRHGLQDCLYIACAERFGAELITADETLAVRASSHFPFVRPLQ